MGQIIQTNGEISLIGTDLSRNTDSIFQAGDIGLGAIQDVRRKLQVRGSRQTTSQRGAGVGTDDLEK